MGKTTICSTRKKLELGMKEATPESFEASLCEAAKQLREKTHQVFLLAYSYNAVQIGKIEGQHLKLRNPLEPQYLQELRLFSVTGELHIWKIGNRFYNRLRLSISSQL